MKMNRHERRATAPKLRKLVSKWKRGQLELAEKRTEKQRRREVTRRQRAARRANR
jgi:hypothetical protein